MPSLAELIAAQKAKLAAEQPVKPLDLPKAEPAPSTGIKLTGLVIKSDPAVVPQPVQQNANPTVDPPSAGQTVAIEGGSSSPAQVPPSLNTNSVEDSTLKDFNHPQMTEGMTGNDEMAFREAVSVLHKTLGDPSMAINATRNILRGLKDNPNFAKFLVPEDCGLMVRSLRESYGIVASSKAANKEKRSSKQSAIDDVAAQLGDVLGSGGLDDLGEFKVG